MKYTNKFKFRLPERDVEGGRDDAADINDLTFNWENNDSILEAQSDTVKSLKENADLHKGAFPIDHPDGSVTDSKIGSRFIGAFSGELQALFTAIGLMFKAITGKDSWNEQPDASLADAKKTMDGLAAHTGDGAVHVSENDKREWNKVKEKLDASAVVQESGSSESHVMSQYAVSDAIASNLSGVMNKNEYAAGGVPGVVDRAAALEQARQISLNGAAKGSAYFDGSEDMSIQVEGINLDYATEGILPVERGGTGTAGGISWDTISGIPSAFAPSAHKHNPVDINSGTIFALLSTSTGNKKGAVLRNISVVAASGLTTQTDHILMKRK